MEENPDLDGITCEELHALRLMFTDWALDKTPCIIEFRLGGDVGLCNLLFVLGAQHLWMDSSPTRFNGCPEGRMVK